MAALELPRIAPFLTEGDIPLANSITVVKTRIILDKPLLWTRFDWHDRPTIFVWAGKRMETNRVPIEKLNIQELMRVAQTAIKNREGLIVDEVLKNKIYK